MENIQLGHDAHKESGKKYPICLLVHDMTVPMNVGSLFRIADALGVEKIFLTGQSISPPNSKIKKTSRSTEKYIPHSYEKDPLLVIAQLRSAGYKIASLEITTTSIDIEEFEVRPRDKICLILGSEADGICQQLLDESDVSVHIPMLGKNSSMNVANACSIATYELTKKLKKHL